MWVPFLLLIPFVVMAGHLGHFVAAIVLSVAIWVILPAKSRATAQAFVASVEARMSVFEKTLTQAQLNSLREQLQEARRDAENGNGLVVLITAILCLLAFWKVWVSIVGFVVVYCMIHKSTSTR